MKYTGSSEGQDGCPRPRSTVKRLLTHPKPIQWYVQSPVTISLVLISIGLSTCRIFSPYINLWTGIIYPSLQVRKQCQRWNEFPLIKNDQNQYSNLCLFVSKCLLHPLWSPDMTLSRPPDCPGSLPGDSERIRSDMSSLGQVHRSNTGLGSENFDSSLAVPYWLVVRTSTVRRLCSFFVSVAWAKFFTLQLI